jgi:hypothetical protein
MGSKFGQDYKRDDGSAGAEVLRKRMKTWRILCECAASRPPHPSHAKLKTGSWICISKKWGSLLEEKGARVSYGSRPRSVLSCIINVSLQFPWQACCLSHGRETRRYSFTNILLILHILARMITFLVSCIHVFFVANTSVWTVHGLNSDS